MTTQPQRRFQQVGPRGRELGLGAPLPPIFGEIGASDVAERITQHAALAGRVRDLRLKVTNLAAGVEHAKTEHEQKAQAAALAGKPIPRAQGVASAEKKLEVAQDDLRGFEGALLKSADNLLAFAWDHRDHAAGLAREREQEKVARAGEFVAAARSALIEAESLAAQRVWLEQASASARVVPFRERSAGDLVQLAGELGRAFEEGIERRAARLAELQRVRAEEEAERPKREAAEEKAKREYDAGRVRYEGLRRTHIGGRPVTPSGQFQEPEPEEESP